jgi:hypothetical protein
MVCPDETLLNSEFYFDYLRNFTFFPFGGCTAGLWPGGKTEPQQTFYCSIAHAKP